MLIIGVTCASARASDSREAEYKMLTASAVEEHSMGHYIEARALFAKAHAIEPNARTLWGMGTAAFEGRQYVDAIELLKASLNDTRKPLTSAQKSQAESLIQRSSDFVAHVALDLTPVSANLTVDGHDIAPDEKGELLVDSGTHQIVVSAGGFQDHIRSVSWAPGAVKLRVRLTPLAASVNVDQPIVPAADPTQKQDVPEQRSSLSVLKWVSLGGAVAAVGVAGAGLALRHAEAERWNNPAECPLPRYSSCSDTPKAVHRWEAMAIAGGATAGVLAITSVVLFLVDRKSNEHAAQAKVGCVSQRGTDVSCRLLF